MRPLSFLLAFPFKPRDTSMRHELSGFSDFEFELEILLKTLTGLKKKGRKTFPVNVERYPFNVKQYH